MQIWKGKNERQNIEHHWSHGIRVYYLLLRVCVLLRLSAMNELITREMLDMGVVTDEILDKYEQYRELSEWMETFKYQFKKFCEEHGYSKWETDYFFMNYVGETVSTRVDTQRMKETDIYIADALTGELNEVNAYEFFSKKSVVKPHVTFKEKK